MFSVVLTSDGSNQISARDHGFTVGDGVFETLQTSELGILSLDRHLRRLNRSAEIVGLQPPNDELILRELEKLRNSVEFTTPHYGRLRITWTAGESELGSLRSDNWSLAIDWQTVKPWPQSSRLFISDVVKYSKSALQGAKTTSYMENVIALNQARAAGFDEAALFNEAGCLAEGSGSNIFVISGGEVLTTPTEAGALAGITREVLLEVAPEIQIRHILIDELLAADAIFLTSSTRDLQAVGQIRHLNKNVNNETFIDLQQRYQVAKRQEWQ